MSNVGSLDRIVRAVLGLLLVALPLASGWPLWGNALAFWASLVVGLVLLATATLAFCPIYAALGLSSKRNPPA